MSTVLRDCFSWSPMTEGTGRLLRNVKRPGSPLRLTFGGAGLRWISDKDGVRLSNDGQPVRIGQAFAFKRPLSFPFSIGMHIRSKLTATANFGGVCMDASASNDWTLQIQPTGAFRVFRNGAVTTISTPIVTAGEGCSLVVVFGTDWFKVFKNGHLWDLANELAPQPVISNSLSVMNRYLTGSSGTVDGDMRDFRVWHRAISEAEAMEVHLDPWRPLRQGLFPAEGAQPGPPSINLLHFDRGWRQHHGIIPGEY